MGKPGITALTGGQIPKICVPLSSRLTDIRRDAYAAAEAGADLLEYRADLALSSGCGPDEIFEAAITARKILPVLFTCRTKREGGAFEDTGAGYLDTVLRALREEAADLLDIELSAYEENDFPPIPKISVPVVLSFHDFSGTPDADVLAEKILKMREAGADAAKIAVMTYTPEDLRILKETAGKAGHFPGLPLILIGMGEAGRETRTDPAAYRSCLTFGTAGLASAPGQIEASELREYLRKNARSS